MEPAPDSRGAGERQGGFGHGTSSGGRAGGLGTEPIGGLALQLHLGGPYLCSRERGELPMSGALIGQTLELWSGELRTIKARIRSLFGHASVAPSAAALLDGLLGPERRKTGWMRAEAAGDSGPWRQQAVLGRSRWDADALRDLVRGYALATLAVPDAVLVIDETGFLKQGTSSCGVQ